MTVHNGSDYSHTEMTITPDNNYHVQLRVPVSVSEGAAESDTFILLIDVYPDKDSPTFTSTPPTNALEGASYTYNVEVTDVDNDAISIAGTVVPPWLILTDRGDGTATLTGTPAGIEVGNHAVVVAATDDNSPILEQAFTVLVAAAPDTPQITIIGSNPLTINQYQAYTDSGALATDVQDGDLRNAITVTGSVNSSIPGTYRITYTVADSAGHLSTAARTVTVRAPVETRRSGGGSTSIPELLCWMLIALSMQRMRRCRIG